MKRVAIVLLVAAAGAAQDVRRLDDATKAALRAHLAAAADPAPYLVGKFARHDVVLLGEVHEIAEFPAFVAAMLAPLMEAGVPAVLVEFLKTSQQAGIDALLQADRFDEERAHALMRQLPWPTWGYRESRDILEAAWRVNAGRPAGSPPLRLLGLDSEWSQVGLWRASDRESFRIRLDRERHMAEQVRLAVAAHRKVLVHVGFAHTVRQGARLAALLDRELGPRMFQIVFHHRVTPAFVEHVEPLLVAALPRGGGFDVAGSPYAGLSDPAGDAMRMAGGSFRQLAEGYLFLAPAAKLRPVTWIPGFIQDVNRDDALAVSVARGLVADGWSGTAAELDLVWQRHYAR